MILTDENRECGTTAADIRAGIVKTPTYHVFDLFKGHQDAELLDSRIETKMVGTDDWHIPNLTESASIKRDGTVNITIANMDLKNEYEIETEIRGLEKKYAGNVSGRILQGSMRDMNTFDDPENVAARPFGKVNADGSKLNITIPPCSVVNLTM